MPPVLLLACGNPLRGDDGFGLHLAETAALRFVPAQLRIVAAQQWTPEMSAEIALATVVVFADISEATPPGRVVLMPIDTAQTHKNLASGVIRETHRLDSEHLLALTEAWYGHRPQRSYLLTAGAISLGYTDRLSRNLLENSLPIALAFLEQIVASSLPSMGG